MKKYTRLEKVKDVLREKPASRSSDKILIMEYIYKFHPELVSRGKIKIIDMINLPSFEAITRCRRKIQERGLYLASCEVSKSRKELEADMRHSILGSIIPNFLK